MAWAILAFVFGGLGVLLVIVLLRIADEEDRSARRTHRRIDPFADVTVTRVMR